MDIHISCKCDTNRAGHFTLDAHASRPVACLYFERYYHQWDIMAAEPHSSPHPRRMLEWSLSNRCMLGLITPQGKWKGWLKNTLNSRRFINMNFIIIWQAKSYEVLHPCGILVVFGCVLQMTFWICISIKMLMLILEPTFRDKNSLGPSKHKLKSLQTEASHIQPQLSRLCGKSSWTITSPNAYMDPPYLGFNAIYMENWCNKEVKQYHYVDSLVQDCT